MRVLMFDNRLPARRPPGRLNSNLDRATAGFPVAAGSELAVRLAAGNAAVARWIETMANDPDRERPRRAARTMLQREVVPVDPKDAAEPGHLWKSTIDQRTFRTREEAQRHEDLLHDGEPEKTEKEETGRDVENAREGGDRELSFSLALANTMKMLLASVRFGAAAHWYDHEFWERDTDDEDALILKPDKRPSDAIAQLHEYSAPKEGYEGVESAKLDCVEIIEVGRWLAEMDVAGREAFDRKYGPEGLRLAAPGSTGIRGTSLATRIGGVSDGSYNPGDAPMSGRMMLKTETEQKLVDLETFLESLPTGGRVMWRNFDKAFHDEHDFKNENTVKIGPDLYAAHPFGTFSLEDVATQVGQGGYEDMQQLLNESAEPEHEPSDDEKAQRRRAKSEKATKYYKGINSLGDYIAKFVRIVEIETFESQV
jgi:hypothetical protein